MWFPKISSSPPTDFPYNPSLYGHRHLCSADGKWEETCHRARRGTWMLPMQEYRLKAHRSQLLDRGNRGESKHQIRDFKNMNIYFNDLKAEPAGLVTVSKRYGEKNHETWIFILTATTGELWTCAHFGLTQGRISVPHAHAITHDRQRPAGQQVSYEHQMWSFTQAISNSLRGVLRMDYFKAHQFSCYNHPSEKTKSDRRTKLGSVSNGKEQRTMQQRKPFLSHALSWVSSLCCAYLPHLWIGTLCSHPSEELWNTRRKALYRCWTITLILIHFFF